MIVGRTGIFSKISGCYFFNIRYCCMNLHVTLHIFSQCKCFTADLTWKWLLPGMGNSVSSQMTISRKLFATHFTFEWFLSCVDPTLVNNHIIIQFKFPCFIKTERIYTILIWVFCLLLFLYMINIHFFSTAILWLRNGLLATQVCQQARENSDLV